MSFNVRCQARRESPVLSLVRICCWDRDRSRTVKFLLICVSEKWHFCVRMFSRYVSCEKWVQYVSWWRWGERIVRILWSHSFLPINGLKTASSLLKGRGHVETHVTLIQQMTVSGWSRFLSTVSDFRERVFRLLCAALPSNRWRCFLKSLM